MGTTTSYARKCGKLIQRMISASDPTVVLVVVYVCLLVDNFQKNLILYSTNLLHLRKAWSLETRGTCRRAGGVGCTKIIFVQDTSIPTGI
mmetsp:Transcript_30733/g.95086  ORF Transcript_30733/g.95086 Transcript_30733/m.95086 type:complete len:90 (-) Transcript_30733:3292-3561(-)